MPRRTWTPLSHFRPALLGIAAGLASTACVLTIGDDHGYGVDPCFDEYGDCMDDADDPDEFLACEAALDSCLAACEDDGYADEYGEGDSSSTDAGDGDGDTDDPPRADTGYEDDTDNPPRADTGDGDGDTDGPDPACFEIHATCVADADTLQEIEACEALFDHCINPGECQDPECEPSCPQDDLDACLDGYSGCLEGASSEAEVLECAAGFDACAAMFDFSLCQPGYDDGVVDACLEQHGLCVDCANTAEELAACKATFDTCVQQG